LDLENFLLKFLDLIIHHEVLKLKLFSQHNLVDKTAQKPRVKQFESTEFQDPQTAAETSGSYYHSSEDEVVPRVKQFESTEFQDPQTSGSYYHSSEDEVVG